MVEGFHSALCKVTQGKAAFPGDDAVLRAVFLRAMDVADKWTTPMPNWSLVLGQLASLFQNLLL